VFIKGISSIDQLDKRSLNFFLGLKRPLSVTLYEEACKLPHGQAVVERILEDFRDDRGAYKRTYSKRFEDFDASALECIQSHFSKNNSGPFRIHDVGVSDATTACDFFERFVKIIPDISYDASDYEPEYYIIEKDGFKIVLSPRGFLCEVVWENFVLTNAVNVVLKIFFMNKVIRFFLNNRIHSLQKDFEDKKLRAKKMRLFSKKALNLESSDTRFHLKKHNLLDNFDQEYHVVRAMNVLNLTYFNEQQFAQIVENIFNALYNGGLFVTGSNQNAGSCVNGGIYKKNEKGFEELWRSGSGSVIDNIIKTFQKGS
jgi:hypothetical protein